MHPGFCNLQSIKNKHLKCTLCVVFCIYADILFSYSSYNCIFVLIVNNIIVSSFILYDVSQYKSI